MSKIKIPEKYPDDFEYFIASHNSLDVGDSYRWLTKWAQYLLWETLTKERDSLKTQNAKLLEALELIKEACEDDTSLGYNKYILETVNKALKEYRETE